MRKQHQFPIASCLLAIALAGCMAKYPGGASSPTPWTPSGAPFASGNPGSGLAPGGFQDRQGVTPGTPATAPVVIPVSGTDQVQTLAGSGIVGLLDGASSSAEFHGPQGVAVAPDGTVYVADTANLAIRAIAPGGTVRTIAGGTLGSNDGTGSQAQFLGPHALAMGPDGNLYVADFDRIRKVTPAGMVTTLPITRADGLQYVEIFGIAIDAQGHMALSTLHRIDWVGSDLVAHALAGATIPGFIDGNGLDARFNLPAGVAIDGQGNVWVADFGNHAIRKVDPAGNVTTVAGNGQMGDVDGVDAAARFNFPSGVAVDASGNVWVADTYDNAIREITPDGTVRTLAGTGQAGYQDGNGQIARFTTPAGLTLGPEGMLDVCDMGNQRIRAVSIP